MQPISKYLENNIKDESELSELDEMGHTVENHKIGEIKKQVFDLLKMRIKNNPSISKDDYENMFSFAMDLVFDFSPEWRIKGDDEVVSVQSVLMDYYIREPLENDK